ncbi:MAG: extracellular solute-binding protein [Methylococcales bacterium]|nr:extracellular solute-binding protein [Methylococcales bacterium]
MLRRAVFILMGILAASPAVAADDFIILQSTTSTENSGFYDYLLPEFVRSSGIEVRVVAVGTGQALMNARNGDADVLIVHAKSAEIDFVAQGYGVERFDLMYNDFVIVGPSNDPAGIAGQSSAGSALKTIADSRSKFVSRGDDSGTHKKELQLWSSTPVDVQAASGTWYLETGSGMGATLNAAVGMGAYTLSDRATWISFHNRQGFSVQVEGDERLFNQYGVIIVNPEKHPHVKTAQAQTFVDWLLSPEGQALIDSYQVDGQQLFRANAVAGH